MTYAEEQKREMTLKLRELLKEMPEFCGDYFRGIEPNSSERTRLGYARDLNIFFDFLVLNEEDLRGKKIKEITLDDLKKVTANEIEQFLEYVTYYNDEEENEHSNGENGKARKLASIRSLFKYLYKHEKLPANPAALVSTPKIHEKTIIRMDVDEIARFLDGVESGEKLTKKQQNFHKATKIRDLAMMTLMLGTGIRVSECVGLDINDVDFNHNGIHIIRKGGNESVVYFGDEVRAALLDYLPEREQIIARDGHEKALFLSLQKRRITVRSVENLVKKYSESVITMKHISPHKLRSSYGTELYNETGDIYLVADVLGHKDVNTTRRHYAQMEDSRRRDAARYVRLREEIPAADRLSEAPDPNAGQNRENEQNSDKKE